MHTDVKEPAKLGVRFNWCKYCWCEWAELPRSRGAEPQSKGQACPGAWQHSGARARGSEQAGPEAHEYG